MEQPFWYIIVNPAAGAGAGERQWPRIEALLQELGFSYTVQFTERRGHAIRLVDDAVLRGHRHFLGIGGDGTNHELVNGIMAQATVPSSEIAYALLPVGTGNDWARAYAIPANPRARLQRLLEGRTVLQDVGLVKFMRDGQPDQRYFTNVAGMAYDAYLVAQLEKRPRRPSKLVYLGLIVKHLFDYSLQRARLRFDGRVEEDLFYTINVGICPYSGGGMRFVPQAVPDDGLLALSFARSLPKWEVLVQTPRFYNGTILKHPRVEGFQVKTLRVENLSDQPLLLEADGELLGEAPADFSVLPGALRVAL